MHLAYVSILQYTCHFNAIYVLVGQILYALFVHSGSGMLCAAYYTCLHSSSLKASVVTWNYYLLWYSNIIFIF